MSLSRLPFVFGLAAACSEPPVVPDLGPPPVLVSAAPSVTDAINPRLLRRFGPLPTQVGPPAPAPIVSLGRSLFYDPRLSHDGDLSCNSCHDLQTFGVDHRPVAVGHAGTLGRRNTPSVFNAAGHVAQFWDGRSPDVELQAAGPMLNPDEMAMTEDEVVDVLRSIPNYAVAFAASWPESADPVSFEHACQAIGAFERGLVSPSPWDAYLTGDSAALSAEEIEGFKLFADIGCVACHTGVYVGGSMFQKVGVMEPWPNQDDQGRFETTHHDGDKMVFKVPSLRNVAMTAPYFHDASAPTLDAAVRKMGRHQLGITLDDHDVALLVAWLGSLTGTIPADYVARPELAPGPTMAQRRP